MYRGIIHDTLKNMIQLSYITCFSSRMNIDKWEKGNYHIQELNESSTNKTSLSVHQKAYRTYPTMNKTDLDTEHISNNPQGFVGIFVLLVKMKPRNYIGRNIQLTNKYNIKNRKMTWPNKKCKNDWLLLSDNFWMKYNLIQPKVFIKSNGFGHWHSTSGYFFNIIIVQLIKKVVLLTALKRKTVSIAWFIFYKTKCLSNIT